MIRNPFQFPAGPRVRHAARYIGAYPALLVLFSVAGAVAPSKTAVVAKPLVSQPVEAADLAPEQWTGVRFMLLHMPPLYRKFGYELYATAKLAAEKAAANPAIELPNHRLKYEQFAGAVLAVASVIKADSGEWLVRFTEEKSGRPVFGRTRKQAIKGIAPADDLPRARIRWAGKTVYSRRGFISMTDSSAGAITTRHVTVQTPLQVSDVVWGVSPLPTQFVWLLVETPQKEKGFVPTFLTWTNVMADSRKNCRPWQDDLLESDPGKTFGWDPAVWEIVNQHTVREDMTRDQVLVSWGWPAASDSADRQGRRCERWTYQGQYLYFSMGRLSAIANR